MMESLFAKNKEMAAEDIIAAVKKEYPGCSFLTGGRTQKRIGWYRSHIVHKGEFPAHTKLGLAIPKWASSGPKTKKTKKAA